MSKGSPSPPTPPDPSQTAQAQTQSNLQTAIANARLNRVNQTTPWGSITYNQGAPDASGVPTYSANIQLSPQQQALLDQQQNMQLQRGGIANQLLDRVGSNLSQPLNLSGLAPINNRGQMYNGAVNAPPPASPSMGMQTDQAMQSAQANPLARGGMPMGNAMMGPQGAQVQQLLAAMQALPPGVLQQLMAALGGGGGMTSAQPSAAQQPQYSPGGGSLVPGMQRQ